MVVQIKDMCSKLVPHPGICTYNIVEHIITCFYNTSSDKPGSQMH